MPATAVTAAAQAGNSGRHQASSSKQWSHDESWQNLLQPGIAQAFSLYEVCQLGHTLVLPVTCVQSGSLGSFAA